MRTQLLAVVVLLVARGPAQAPETLLALDPAARLVAFAPGSCAVQTLIPLSIATAGNDYISEIAWDPTARRVWVASGSELGLFDADTGATLATPIPTFTAFGGGIGSVGGLAIVESQGEVLAFSLPGQLVRARLVWPPPRLASCQTGFSMFGNLFPAGLAVDEGNGLVFLCVHDVVTQQNTIHVATLADPCAPFQSFVIGPCAAGAFGFATGITVDWSQQILYAAGSNGRVLAWDYAVTGTGTPPVVFTVRGCCSIAGGVRAIAVRPGGATATGTACANGGCACALGHSLSTDPVLGNGAFRLAATAAESGALVFAVIGAGPCAATGSMVPPLCGPVLAQNVLGVLGPVIVGSAPSCGGVAEFALPLPLMSSLRGAVVGSQAIALCAGSSGFGTAASQCLSFRLQGL
jgi:hypothetical protein